MATAPLKTYDLSAVVFTLDGITLSGFGETDAVSYERASEIIDDGVSADGEVTVSRTNDRRVYAVITVMETSLAARRLDELYKAQRTQLEILPMPFFMVDPISGDRISDQYAVFKEVPLPSKGKRHSERVFRLLLPNGLDNEALAELVAA